MSGTDTSTSQKPIKERPLDPSGSGEDFVGDSTGMTGITSGNPKNISATPEATPHDDGHLPGGILRTKHLPTDTEVPKKSYSQRVYREHTQQEMSSEAASFGDEKASGEEKSSPSSPHPSQDAITLQGAQTVSTNENAKVESPEDIRIGTDRDPLTARQGEEDIQTSPDEAGEQSVSGDMPTPDSDDDTLANAQALGTQTEEDPEHPKEVDIG